MNLDFFDELQKDKILYPKEVLPMLTNLFLQIGYKFDFTESIKSQLGGRKKKDYEKLLNYLQELIKNGNIEDWDGGVRYVIAKSIEKEIFKNLDFFHYYNLYSDPDRRKLKEYIDNAIFKNYETLEEEDSISPEEIQLFIDGEEIIGNENILNGLNSVKKNKIALSKTNIKYNKFLEKLSENENENSKRISLMPEVIMDLEEKKIGEVLDKKVYFSEVGLIAKNYESEPIHDLEEKLFYFLSEQDFIYQRKGRLREYTKENKIIFDLNLNRLTRLEEKRFSYGFFELMFSDDIKYYDSININLLKIGKQPMNFLSLFQYDDIEKIKELLNSEDVEKLDINGEKLYSGILLSEINLKGRIYKNKKEIYTLLSNLDPDQPFLAKFEDGKELLVAKNLSLFIFLQNKNLIKTIKYKMITKSVEDKIIFKYSGVTLTLFNEMVRIFFEYLKEDYEEEFEDDKIVHLQANGFNKGDIKKFERTFKYQLDYLEGKTNFSRILKNLS